LRVKLNANESKNQNVQLRKCRALLSFPLVDSRCNHASRVDVIKLMQRSHSQILLSSRYKSLFKHQ